MIACFNQNKIDKHESVVCYTISRMVQWVTERQDEDHMVNPDYPKDKKANPWLEQKKCVLL